MLQANLHLKRKRPGSIHQDAGVAQPSPGAEQKPAGMAELMAIFGKQYEKPERNWSDKLSLLGGTLMDLDGTWGGGHADKARGLYDERVDEGQEEFDRRREEQLRLAAAGGDEAALGYLDPVGTRQFNYGVGRDKVTDTRYADERDYGRGRDAVSDSRYSDERDYSRGRDKVSDTRYGDERDYGRGRDRVGDAQWEAEFGLKRDKLTAEQAADAAEGAATPGGLRGMAPGVQTAIVNSEIDAIKAAEEEAARSREAADLAKRFTAIGDNYMGFGGGPLANVAQVFSQKTAPLKGVTERLVMLQKKPGTGTMTDDDARRAQKATVNINQGKKANQDAQAVYAAIEKNDSDYVSWLRSFQSQGGYGDQNQAKEIWQAYSQANPAFDENGSPNAERVPINTWIAAMQRKSEIEAELDALEQEESVGRAEAYDMRGYE